MEDDLFDSLLGLEDQYYKEGYDLGVTDGTQAGFIGGRLCGLEKGFEKYVGMGKLYGRSVVWAGRLLRPATGEYISQRPQVEKLPNSEGGDSSAPSALPPIPNNARTEKHIRTLYALAEFSSLSTENNGDSVSEFDDRLKRADGKNKIIEHALGEFSLDEHTSVESGSSYKDRLRIDHISKADGSIEDVSSLHIRH